MRILGIESSCDETGVAVLDVEPSGEAHIFGECLASQVALHEKYGGVVPELASREHMRNLPLLLEELFSKSGVTLKEIDGIGVTCGPGLKGCLLIGVTFAQGLAAARQVPLFPVNHIEGHILSGELHTPGLKPPYIALVVSGGHTEILLVEGLGKYSCLCRTRDDAAGEAFDKSANLLGLNYPGGARLAATAEQAAGRRSRFTLPRVGREMEDFSFSGLKTAVLLLIKKSRELLDTDPTAMVEICWTIQDAIVDALVVKAVREVMNRGLPLVVCGGVSANTELRRRLQAKCPEVHVPPLRHCVDNGAMIAYVAASTFIAAGQLKRCQPLHRCPHELQAAPEAAEGHLERA
jgi:N6-L-threonylcarbamoyladenine synthase